MEGKDAAKKAFKLAKLAKTVAMFPIWIKIVLFLPFVILLFILIYTAFYIEVVNESVVCIYDNCDKSEPERNEQNAKDGAEYSYNQDHYQHVNVSAVSLASATRQQGKVRLVVSTIEEAKVNKKSGADTKPYQRETNQYVTDAEILTLADQMKKARDGLLGEGLDEPAETYGTVQYLGPNAAGGSSSGGSVDNYANGEYAFTESTGPGDKRYDPKYWQWAVKAASVTGWNPLFIYSQWSIETTHFTSPNFVNNNNLGGQTWTPSMGAAKKGTARPANEGGYYVKYDSPVEGYLDFVATNPRYKHVKEKATPEEQAKELASQGWATDGNYLNLLLTMIKQNRKYFGDIKPVAGGASAVKDSEKTGDSSDDKDKKDEEATKDEDKDKEDTSSEDAESDGTGTTDAPLENTEGDKIVAEAYRMLETQGEGSPNPITYSMPKRGQPGYGDCSWFTSTVYKNALGVDIGSTTIQQIAKNADNYNTDRSQLRPGDLVYFNKKGGFGHTQTINGKSVSVDHTGIFVGDNKFIDLSSSVGTIKAKDISQGQYKTYFDSNFIGFIRLGEPGTGNFSGTFGAGPTVDEAELHLRALMNSDWYALKGVDIFKRDPKTNQVVRKKGWAVLKDEFKDTMIEKTYLVARELKEDKENRLINYVSGNRYKDWDETDWMLNARFMAYECYMIGDKDKVGGGFLTKIAGFIQNPFEWIATLFSKDGSTCNTLDTFLKEGNEKKAEQEKDEAKKEDKKKDEADKKEDSTKSEDKKDESDKKDGEKTNGETETKAPEPEKTDPNVYIEEKDRGVLTQWYEKREHQITCNPPKEDTSDKAKQTKGVKGKVKQVAVNEDESIDVNAEDTCGDRGILHDEIIDTAKYPTYPSKYAGAKEKSVLKNFEKYSLIIPDKTTWIEDTYPSEIERILRLFYGDSLDQNDGLLNEVGGGLANFIVPMEDGTYNFSSAFRGEGRPSHDGDDLGTLDISGVPIYATANGVVESTGFVGGYGNSVMIKHNDGYYSFYAHMKKDYIVVKKGQAVVQGQLVGATDGMGDKEEGSPSLPMHLHFEMCERAVVAQSGNSMCADHVDPEDDDDSKDNRPDDVKLTFNKEEDKSKAQERAKTFLKEWKEKAKNGTVYMMPGFSAVRGVLSEQNESPTGLCVNNAGDAGGLSCGFYQFANNPGKICEFVRWLGKNNYSDYYNAYISYCPSGSSRVSDVNGFLKKWNDSKERQSAEFKNAQYLFVKSQHYDVVAKKAYKDLNFDVNTRHVAVQEMFWSIGVQQPGHITSMFKSAGYSSSTNWDSVSDRDIISKVYDARYNGIPKYFSSSPGMWKGLRNRFLQEKKDALAMLGSS